MAYVSAAGSRSRLQRSQGTCLGREAGAEVVGFVAVVLEPEGGAGSVELLAVDPEHQGRDVGTTLTEFASTWMKEAGVTLASIWTGGDPGHAPARRTYEKAGYTALPLARNYKAL
ncbi:MULTISPECIES: N-acetyltransferase [unclassified Streptomyces]|uniref:GNAT family N-acetyltransferase n=1 Tax=unclassified Streptomyces TaxID=2593676 RepID=UPI001F1F3A15|nr:MULTISPECIES: GNAT family N-acetyltransferase [unclassified Streptomyces]